MKRIKTFEFVVNCHQGSFIRQYDSQEANKIAELVTSSEKIDEIINDYIKNKTVVNIIENFYTVHRCNNCGDDTVIRNITVVTDHGYSD